MSVKSTSHKRVVEVVLLVCLLVFASGLVAAWLMSRPQGQPTPQALVSRYLQALEASDAAGIEELVSPDLDAEREAAQHVREWGGIPSEEARMTYTESTLGKVQYIEIWFDSRLEESIKLHLVRLHDGWYLALGMPREKVRPGPSDPPLTDLP